MLTLAATLAAWGGPGAPVSAAGTTVRLDMSSVGEPADYGPARGEFALTADGEQVLFTSSASNLAPWKTNLAWEGSCRRLVLKFTDGTHRCADFQFTR